MKPKHSIISEEKDDPQQDHLETNSQ